MASIRRQKERLLRQAGTRATLLARAKTEGLKVVAESISTDALTIWPGQLSRWLDCGSLRRTARARPLERVHG